MARGRRVLFAVAAVFMSSVSLFAAPGRAAPTYSVALSADPTTLETGQSTTLTVTASHDLTGTRWITYIFDQTDPAWYRTCKVQTCSFSVAQSSPGTHSYVAYVARERSDPRYPPVGIQATSNTVTVTWTAPTYTVSLQAESTWVTPGSTVILTATANKDMAGRSLAIQIFDLAANQQIASCETGTSCTAEAHSVAPATRAYQAFIAPPAATPPPPNSQASSEVVTITWSVLPDPTRPPNAGGGLVKGDVVFTEPGVPPLGADCATTTFHFEGSSATAWVNGSVTTYVGPLNLVADGGSPCERVSTGDGSLTVWASGRNPLDDELTCGPLTGTFTRIAGDVVIVVAGDCTINGVDAFSVIFNAAGQFTPTNPGGGVTEPVKTASFAGSFAVSPS